MDTTELNLDFNNTQIAFAHKPDSELKATTLLFKLMNKPRLVEWGSTLSLFALKLHFPFTKWIIKKSIFTQFCGGTTLLETQSTVDHLQRHRVLTVLDYGAEGQSEEPDLDQALQEFLRAIEFAGSNSSIPVVSTKVTALASDEVLERVGRRTDLSTADQAAFERVQDRLDQMCRKAAEIDVKIFVDAEESWMQETIDRMVEEMMEKYNREKVVVYNTFQMYRTDRLDYLKSSYADALAKGYMLGAKLVRGAYMEKERERAAERGYPSPIYPDKQATDHAYDEAVRFCVDHYDTMASCNASHNAASNLLQARLIVERGIHRNHPHLNFCQLQGMSDNITFNLADAGFNVAKYVVYGPVQKVIHYLIRRAEENTSVTGDLSRELALLQKEKLRRGI
ncbi:MAG: proline dehydrogenase family protein [Saprospiraceae bacterium]